MFFFVGATNGLAVKTRNACNKKDLQNKKQNKIHERFIKNKLYKEMSVWNCMEESNWHHQPKVIEKTTEGQCKYCGKHVKALEAHMHDKHKHEMKLEEDRCCH
jgi:hypothetical protein